MLRKFKALRRGAQVAILASLILTVAVAAWAIVGIYRDLSLSFQAASGEYLAGAWVNSGACAITAGPGTITQCDNGPQGNGSKIISATGVDDTTVITWGNTYRNDDVAYSHEINLDTSAVPASMNVVLDVAGLEVAPGSGTLPVLVTMTFPGLVPDEVIAPFVVGLNVDLYTP